MKKSTLYIAALGAAIGGVLLGKKLKAASAPLDTSKQGSISWWTDDDFRAFAAMAQRLRMSPADLLVVLYGESGLQPWARNPRDIHLPPIALGLNQITRSGSSSWLPEAEWRNLTNLSVAQQLPYVERYFRALAWVRAGNAFNSANQIYLANFAPAFLSRGTDPNMVLYSREKSGDAYEKNKILDFGNKGFITFGDLGKYAQSNVHQPVFLAGLARLRNAIGDPTLSPVFI